MRRRRGLIASGALTIAALFACWQLSFPARVAQAVAEAPQHNAGSAGRTWENYFGVAILSSGRAIVVGDKGLVMATDDQGKTWSRQQLKSGDTPFDLYSIAFTPDGSRGWIAGDGGSMYRSDDQGKTWTLQPTKVAAALMKVAVVDGQKACAVGEHGAVLCTSDGGATWNAQKFEDMVFFDLTFTDANTGWAVGEFQTVLNTTDGGKSWTVKNGGKRTVTADPYFAIAFDQAGNGLVLGLNGIDLTSHDGGKSWKEGELSGNPYSFYAAVANGSDTYVGGADGITGRIAQGQLTRTTSVASNSINGVAFGPQYGLAVGLSGTVMRTDNSGQSWSGLTIGGPAQARAQ
jgi:photosystem II stability/assembly factor-like uncharacterized protein